MKATIKRVIDVGSCSYCQQGEETPDGKNIIFPYTEVIKIEGNETTSRLCPTCAGEVFIHKNEFNPISVLKGARKIKKSQSKFVDKLEVGERIKLIRSELNLSMSEFGERIGSIPKSNVNSWVRGLALPPPELLNRIAFISHKSVNWILWGNDSIVVCPICESVSTDGNCLKCTNQKQEELLHLYYLVDSPLLITNLERKSIILHEISDEMKDNGSYDLSEIEGKIPVNSRVLEKEELLYLYEVVESPLFLMSPKRKRTILTEIIMEMKENGTSNLSTIEETGNLK